MQAPTNATAPLVGVSGPAAQPLGHSLRITPPLARNTPTLVQGLRLTAHLAYPLWVGYNRADFRARKLRPQYEHEGSKRAVQVHIEEYRAHSTSRDNEPVLFVVRQATAVLWE